MCGAVNIVSALFRVIRDGIIFQVAAYPDASRPDHLSFTQYRAGFPRPLLELVEALSHFLAARASFDLEVPLAGFAAIVGEPQKGELLWLFPAFAGICPREPPELDAMRLVFRQFQAERFEPFL